MRFNDEGEIAEIVRGFEDATIARGVWKHAEHLIVALHYVDTYGVDKGLDKMKTGLINLLTNGFEIDLAKEMPYHETLTIFWMKTVAEFNASKDGASLLDKANELVETYDKDYPLKFYSRAYLFSDDARAKFVEGVLVHSASAVK